MWSPEHIEKLFESMKEQQTLWVWGSFKGRDSKVYVESVARGKQKEFKGLTRFVFPAKCVSCGQTDIVCLDLFDNVSICGECIKMLSDEAAILFKKHRMEVILETGKNVKAGTTPSFWVRDGGLVEDPRGTSNVQEG